ncbi:MAG: nucleotidyl transferase AbiEii/AbiGii toxin family protein [Candidatus Marinimicrobia bacterium]|nr:nucleotidyl transferase AbiEii/AbiGii toxin family protein [Candidatus Neomarinimicrobiota bacterium]
MFEYSKYELDDLARKTQFQFGPLEKALRILDILRLFNSHPVLQDQFVLKGGTALNFFLLDVPRLSVDIDLNFIGELERESALKVRKIIESVIPNILSGEYEVTCTREAYALLQYQLRYKTLHGGDDALRLDLNFLDRFTVLEPVVLEFDRWGERVSFTILDINELIAGKTRALLSRYTARDLYDLYRIDKLGIELDHDVLHELFLYALLTASESHSDLLPPNWNKILSIDVQRNLRPMLIRGENPDVKSMKDGAKQILDSMVALSQVEAEIFMQFDATGKIKLDLLFRESFAARIDKSPAFQWKKQNLIRISS